MEMLGVGYQNTHTHTHTHTHACKYSINQNKFHTLNALEMKWKFRFVEMKI